MTDAKQTKCPHCGSTFRISDAQLAAKGGSVRCGSCLQVFRADLHLVGAAAAPAAAAAAAAAAPPRPRTKGGPADESWALELLGEKKAPPAPPAPARPAPPAAKAGADEWAMPAGDEAAAGADAFGFSEDEISAFMTSDANVKAPQGKSLLFDDELSEFLEEAPASGLLGGAEEAAHKLSENADESWAQSMLSELEQEEKKESGKQYGMEILDGKSKPAPKNPKLAAALGHRVEGAVPATPGKGKAAGKAAAADDFLGEDADVLSFLDEDDLSSTSAPPPIAPNPFSLERPLANVDAPVVLKPHREPINWGYLLSWTLLCLIAGVMFVAQFVYFNFESLAVQPNVRPYFERACARLDCRLPDIPDPSKLRTEDLVVRKHPDVPGALMVDAILKNSAPFAQPMPSLMLRFRNNADEVVASRLLRPTDYLQGEARLLRRLPPDTPIHISLAIVDPGASAVSYSLEPVL